MFMLPKFLLSLETELHANSAIRAEIQLFTENARPKEWDVRRRISLRFVSVAPRFCVGVRGCGREHVLDHFRQYTLGPVGVVLLHCVFSRAACIAVRHARTILECRVGMGITCFLKLLVEQVYGIVEEVGIAIPDGDMQLALKLRAERGPVAFENCGEVVMIVPIRENFFVD